MRSNLMTFKKGGFTLVELLIAMFIFVVLIVLLTTVTISMTKTSVSAQDSSDAQSLLLDGTSRTTRDISYATRILRSDPQAVKLETVENGKCRRTDWSIVPAVDSAGNPILRDPKIDPDQTQQRYDLVNTIEFYAGQCPDDNLATFNDANALSDPTMIPVIEDRIVIFDFWVNPNNPIVFEYFDENDKQITEADTPKSFIRRIRFTYGTSTVDRTNPLTITTSAVPYAGGNPTETSWATVVPVAPMLGATVTPLELPNQPVVPNPDLQWVDLTWTNPTPAITTGYVLYRYADVDKNGVAEQTQILESIDPNQTTFEDRELPRGACARYQIFAVTTKGLSAGSNYRDLCMPPDPVQNLEVRVTQCNVDTLGPTSNQSVAGLVPGALDFSVTRNPVGQATVQLSWDAVYAEPAAGVGYDIYFNDMLVATIDGAGGGWDAQSRNVMPLPAGQKVTWTTLLPLDRNDEWRVTPFTFMETNQGNVVKLEAYNIDQRADRPSTVWGSTVDSVTCSAPQTLRHSYPGGDQVRLTWTDSAVERGYRIYRSPMTQVANKSVEAAYSPQSYDWVHGPNMVETAGRDSDYAWSLVYEAGENVTTWTTSAPVGSKYVYKVVAWNRAGMWPIGGPDDAINPENWVADDGGPSGSGILVDHNGYMSRTVNTAWGRPTPSQPRCEVDMSNRTVNVAWDPGILYPEDARIDIYRSGTSDLSTQGRFVHQENQKWAGLGYYVNANSTPNGQGVPSSNSNAGNNTATGAFNQVLNAQDANAPAFGPGTIGQGVKGGGYWIVPSQYTRWGDAFRYVFTTSNEAGRSDPREISCYIPMPTADVVPGTVDNGPGVAAADEADIFNLPSVRGMQMNNYRVRWTWGAPSAAYNYTQKNVQYAGRPDYQSDGGYQYWVYFVPVDRNAPAKGGSWLDGQPENCLINPENLGGYPNGPGVEPVKLSSTEFTYDTVSKQVAAGAPGSQSAFDHDVWIYAVNLETGKRIMTSTSCHVKGGSPTVAPVGPGPGVDPSRGPPSIGAYPVQAYGIKGDPAVYAGSGAYVGLDTGNDDGNMALDITLDEYADFQSVTVANASTFWPSPMPSRNARIYACNSPYADPAPNCSNLTSNPNNGVSGNVPWVRGRNTFILSESLSPAFPYWYRVTFTNRFGSSTETSNTDRTYPPTNIMDPDKGTNWQGKPRAWWNEGCAPAVDFTHQETNFVFFHFKRAELDLTNAVNNKCALSGGELSLIAQQANSGADYKFIYVDGLGIYPYNSWDVHRAYGYFDRGGVSCLPGGFRGQYCTYTMNPARTGRISHADPNRGFQGAGARRTDADFTISKTANIAFSASGPNCRTYNAFDTSVGNDLGPNPGGQFRNNGDGGSFNSSIEKRNNCSYEYTGVPIPDPGKGFWTCNAYNEPASCVYTAEYSNRYASILGAPSDEGCGNTANEDCWKHGGYSFGSVTFWRMSDKSLLVKPTPIPRPTCGPDSLPYKACTTPKP